MTVSTGGDKGVDTPALLLSELARVKRENRRLSRQVYRLRGSRDRWRAEAWYWKRGYLGKFTHGTPAFIRADIELRRKAAA